MKHDGGPTLTGLADAIGVELPADAEHRLELFEALLVERAVPLGMVAESDAGRIRVRHVADCLRAAAALRPDDRLAYDVGSGAGLPGVVVAIVRPDLEIRLVEPRRTRIAFLELAVETLGLTNATVTGTRIEDVTDPADLCLARAFAPLRLAWRVVWPLLRPGGRLVYFAGAAQVAQVAEPGTGSSASPGPAQVVTGGGLEEVSPASSVEVLPPPVLESAGPLIIMTR